MQKQEAKFQSILFRVTESALIVANTGKAFTREGVISLCHLHLSEKQKVIKDDYGCDLNLIDKIASRRLRTYENDINLLGEHVRGEATISGDYHDRLLLELLQNANDAVDEQCPTLIGAKGIGFKSVLQISREPSIYSGVFSFCFSKDKTRERIKEIVQISDNENVPVFRVPHTCEPDKEIKEITELKGQKYVTVIRLPFKDTEAREQTIKQLQELSAECLLFCPHLNCIEIEIQTDAQEIKREIRLERHGVFGAEESKVDLTTTENGQKESKSWQQWMREEKGISASIALPLDKGKAVRCTDKPLHVFFPSDEKLPKIGALIHASFEIQSNRQRLNKQQKNAVDICGMIKEMTKDILCSVPPKTGLLAFGKANAHPNEDEGVIGTMCQSIAEAVAETAFVPILGGGECKPKEIKLWENNFGDLLKSDMPEVMGERLLCNSLQKDEEVFSILDKLGARGINNEDYFRILQYCKNGSVEDCCNAIKFAVDKFSDDVVINEHLRKIPFWLLGTNRARSYDGDCPILMECLLPWPEWLRVDVLSPGFKKAFEGINDRRKLPCVPLEKEDFIEKVLVPHCDGKDQKWWRENGTKILRQASDWLGNNPVEDLIIGQEDERNKVGRVIRVPTKKGWIPAIECYAGSKWGGYKQFDGMEKVILPIKDKEWKKIKRAKKEEYIPLLKWLGVSRIPKLYVVEGYYNESISALAPEYNDIIRQHLHRMGLNSVNNIRQFYFDESAIMKIRSIRSEEFAVILVRLHRMAKEHRDFCCYRGSRLEFFNRSLAFYQLKHLEWIRCTPGIVGSQDQYQKPSNIYAPEKSFGGLLPEVIKINDERRRYEFLEAMKDLGMKDALPVEKSEVIELIKKLYENGQTNDEAEVMRWDGTRGAVAKATKDVYSQYINSFGVISGALKVPCIRKTDKGEFMYFTETAYWLDEQYLEEATVRNALLKEGIHIFIMSLKGGRGAGLKKLSEYLELKPQYGDLDSEKTCVTQENYKRKKLFLECVTEFKFSENISIQVYKSLRFQSHANKRIDNINTLYYIDENNDSIVHVNGEEGINQALAVALDFLSKGKASSELIEILLNEEGDKGCYSRLRIRGITEEHIKSIESQKEKHAINGDGGEIIEIATVPNDSSVEGDSKTGDGATRTGIETQREHDTNNHVSVANGVDNNSQTNTNSESQRDIPRPPSTNRDGGIRHPIGDGHSGGGESDEHKEMKEDIRLKPGLFNLDVKGRKEKKLLSGDKVDVVFETDDEYVIVEVKSEISRRSDLIRGLYQCVKYRAVVNAMLSVAGKSKEVQVFLFITCKLPPWLDEKRKMLEKVAGKINIKTKEDLKQFRASTDDEQGSH